ncbi:DNA-binding response regulator [Elizabethkingia anophelis]|uniref:Histidine kinase n=1 Tax=Chryseobacterium indologenes TaxID=253 RepID=A0A0N0ZYC3_CHRID|nr:response regulator transcription factor [Chryseobacterium indologenes]KPE52546.1 histidine kinase [Chryseobacterium indologenes]MDV3734005.1 DNA-binding response regulator [Elizabethkingia anophelis]
METIKTSEKNSLALINDKSPVLDFICKDLVASGIKILFRSENVDDGLIRLSALQEAPQVCIIDLNFNNENMLAQLRVLKSKYPTIKLIVHNDKDDKQIVIPLLEIGIESYLLIGSDADDFKKAIENVTNGKRYFSMGVSKIVQNYFKHF